MTDREKLIDLLWQCVDLDTPFGEIADYLLSNGVRLEPKQATSDENKRWIPVTERLPDPFVVVYVYDYTIKMITDAYMTRHREWVGVRMNHEVTHWMPLPEPPNE